MSKQLSLFYVFIFLFLNLTSQISFEEKAVELGIDRSYGIGNYGGGIASLNSTLMFTDVDITGNSVNGNNGLGGGIFSIHSEMDNTNVKLLGNSASKSGNGIYQYDSSTTNPFVGGDSEIIISW